MKTEHIRIFEGEKYSAAITTTNQLVIWNNGTHNTLYFKAYDGLDYSPNYQQSVKDKTLSLSTSSPRVSASGLIPYTPPSFMATPDPVPDPYSVTALAATSVSSGSSSNFVNSYDPPKEYCEVGIYEDSNASGVSYYLLALSKSKELYKFKILEKKVKSKAPFEISLSDCIHFQVGNSFKKLLVVKNKALALDVTGKIFPVTSNVQKISQPYIGYSFKDLVMTDNHFVGLFENNSLVTWGYCNEGNIAFSGDLLKKNVSSIFSGENVTVLLYGGPNLISIKGNDKSKQISDANEVVPEYIFETAVKDATRGTRTVLPPKIKKIVVTDNLCFMYCEDNTLKVWGKDKDEYENLIPKIVSDSEIIDIYPGRKSVFCLIKRTFNGEPSYSIISWGVSKDKEKFITNPDYISSDVYIPDLFFSTKPSLNFDIDFIKHGFTSNDLETLLSNDANEASFRFNGEIRNDVTGLVFIKTSEDSSGSEVFNLRLNTVPKLREKIWDIIDPIDGKYYILKRISYVESDLNEFDFYNSLRDEALNQIILYNQRDINICGNLKYVLLSKNEDNVGYIIQEKFQINIIDFLTYNLTAITDIEKLKEKYARESQFFKYIITLCKKLKALESKGIEFNHRDLKYDNIMINITAKPSGEINYDDIYLIDFGISCIDLEKYKTGFDTNKFYKTKCYKESRDLTHFFISCLYIHENASKKGVVLFNPNTYSRISYYFLDLKLKDKSKECRLNKGCKDEKLTAPSDENISSYTKFLNKSYIFNPKTSLENIENYIQKNIIDFILSEYNRL
jgi:hypothetical protein